MASADPSETRTTLPGVDRPFAPEHLRRRPRLGRLRTARAGAAPYVDVDGVAVLGSEGRFVRSAPRDTIRRRMLAAGDVIAAATAFILTAIVLGQDALGIGAAIAVALVIPICKASGLYDRDEHLLHKTTLDEGPALFRVAVLYTMVTWLAGGTIVDGHFGRDEGLLLLGLLLVLLVLMRAASRRLAGRLVDGERCLVLGDAESAERLAAQLDRCVGAKAAIVGRMPLDGGFDSLGAMLRSERIDRAVIAPRGDEGDARLLEAIGVVNRVGIQVSVLPSLFEVVGSTYELDQVEGSTLLGLRRHGLSRSSQLLKRAFDLCCGSLLLLAMAPLMAMIALAIKLDSRGPVFFRQRRVGFGDQVFEIFKFRTMIDGAEAQRAALTHRNEASGGLFKIEADPRITRVGRFLRQTSLDELAQLLNVLHGEMSLVGPRPLILDEDKLIEGHHRRRLSVPPGVTGLWQILGSARIPLDEMVKIDYLYGANWSLWLDVKILIRTIPFVLARRGL